MGLFDFIKGAGEKLEGSPQGKEAEQAWRQASLKNVPAKHGLAVEGFDVKLDGDVATITGKVPSQEVREKIVLAIGNTNGVAKVDDRLEVAAPTAAPASAGTASGAATSASASAPAAASTMYTVQKGDNLSKIAKQHYGDASKYNLIFEANKPMLAHPDKIYPGQVLRIPPKS